MVDANYMQERMQALQQNDGISDIFSKIVSGRAGYKAVIEKKHVPVICKNCNTVLDDTHKFCFECGTKIEKPEKN
jgi:hypothetical protein